MFAQFDKQSSDDENELVLYVKLLFGLKENKSCFWRRGTSVEKKKKKSLEKQCVIFWMSHVNSYQLHVLLHIKAVTHLPGGWLQKVQAKDPKTARSMRTEVLMFHTTVRWLCYEWDWKRAKYRNPLPRIKVWQTSDRCCTSAQWYHGFKPSTKIKRLSGVMLA